MAGPQYVYHMQGVSKTYPGGKKVFENIHLSFLPDAKIGVVGANGAGKSTLLRIMSGVETDFNGEAWAADGIRVGYLQDIQGYSSNLQFVTYLIKKFNISNDRMPYL